MAARTPRTEGSGADIVYIWSGVLTTDTCNSVMPPSGYNDRSIQITGTPGAGLVVDVQGSNDPASSPTGFCGMREPGNARLNTLLVAANLASGDIREILESSIHVQPVPSSGDGTTNLTIRLKCSKSNK